MPVQVEELRSFISEMYSDVARFPRAEFHFATGRPIMDHLGYPADMLDQIPATAIESFAGVGYHFGPVSLRQGDTVLDVGCGSGADTFYAALSVGPEGSATGIDMTDAMLDKASKSRGAFKLDNVRFDKCYMEALPYDDASFDCVISNGVINLSPHKSTVFSNIHRVLKPNGRLALSDIVTGVDLPSSIRENCELWAECIGGAELHQNYLQLIRKAGFEVEQVIENDYHFIQQSTINAAAKFKVHSISVAAKKSSQPGMTREWE